MATFSNINSGQYKKFASSYIYIKVTVLVEYINLTPNKVQQSGVLKWGKGGLKLVGFIQNWGLFFERSFLELVHHKKKEMWRRTKSQGVINVKIASNDML